MAKVEVFARTEVGCSRERNEDAFLVLDLEAQQQTLQPGQRVHTLAPPGVAFAVCDGMGGAAAGDLASRMAADVLQNTLLSHAPIGTVEQAQKALVTAAVEANRAILEYTEHNPSHRGMGTTMTAAVAFGPRLVIGQVGDSRAYLRRGRSLTQLTVDQNVVGQLVATGQITAEEGRNYEQRNVLLQAIGVQETLRPELVVVEVRAGDVLLLCTDGLHDPMPDKQILDLMVRFEDPMRCCRALTEAACAAGGPDNVSCAVARFTGEGLELPLGREPVKFERRVPEV